MASEMIERCCREYWNAGLGSGYAVGKWDDQPEDQKATVRHRMRAAIEAMREPTTEMLGASWSRTDRLESGTDLYVEAWRAMIDTALADPLPVHDRLTDDALGSKPAEE